MRPQIKHLSFLGILLLSMTAHCSIFPSRQTDCSALRPCPSGQSCNIVTSVCEVTASIDMAASVDLSDWVLPPGMVRVPGGQFMMGSDTGELNEKPVHAQTVQAFALDITEVTVGAYKTCVDTMGCSLPVSGIPCNWGQSGKDNHPINCIPWLYADKYCKKIGKRLPTEIEFEYAMRGPSNAPYSWGTDVPISPPDSRAQLCWNRKTNPSIATCVVGSYPKTLLGALDINGVYDLAGNVDEFTSHLECGYPLTPDGGQNCSPLNDRSVRGRSFFEGNSANLRAAYRSMAQETSYDATIGFRCAYP